MDFQTRKKAKPDFKKIRSEQEEPYINKIVNDVIDKTMTQPKFIKYSYQCWEKIIDITAEEIKVIYGYELSSSQIKNIKKDLDKYLYDDKLYERVNKIFKEVRTNQGLIQRLCLILHNESNCIHNKLTLEIVKLMGYVAGGYDGDCDCHDASMSCADHFGLYLLEDLPEAPFHPGCECEPDYYQFDDLSDAEKEELGLKDLVEQTTVE